MGLPGRSPKGSNQSLKKPSNEEEGVLSCDDKVKSRENNNSMDHQANDNCDGVHAKLATHLCEIIHLHNLPSNEEQDTKWSIPEGSTATTN